MQDRRGAPPQPSDELGTGLLATARRVGHLAWFERRCFEWLGAWSTVPVDPPVTVLLGEAAARHGWHAEVLVARLPELREVDRGSLVVPPDGAAEAFLRAVTVDPDPGSVLDALVGQLAAQDAFALDTETTALRAVDADIVGYVFSWQAGMGWYVPVRGDHGEVLDPDMVAARLKPILENEKTLKVGQNLKYDIITLRRAGIELKGPLFDTMVAASLLNPGRRTYNMDDLARDLLGYTTTPISDLIGKGKDQLSMLQVPLAKIAAYAAEDADITWRLYERLAQGLDAEPVKPDDRQEPSVATGAVLRETRQSLKELFQNVEMPLVRVLARMEHVGVGVDADTLRSINERLTGEVEALAAELRRVAGRDDLNLNSPTQLRALLYEERALSPQGVKKTKSGYSTDAQTLEIYRRMGDRWLVEQGLAAGDRVIVEGLQKVRPGSPVRVVDVTADAAPAGGGDR